MIPFIIYYLVNGLYFKAFYIFLIYAFLSLLKEIIETYMYNKSLKIPNILLLISMIIHLYFYGFIGLFLSMIHMNVLFAYIESKKK